jgi:hypothetical protein
MKIDSIERKGVSQKFSMKAVNDISIISSGDESSLPSMGFFGAFVSSFGYRRIGILCTLKNDVFTLRGTIRESGREYLVRRTAFFGIDVVNRKPENFIGFEDMLGRLKRIGKSQKIPSP